MINGYEMIVAVVNSGYASLVMDSAKEMGARGGTIISGRGTADKQAETLFGITVQPDKDLVLILVPTKIRDDVLHSIYQNAGVKTDGQGIAFSMPVDSVVGLGNDG